MNTRVASAIGNRLPCVLMGASRGLAPRAKLTRTSASRWSGGASAGIRTSCLRALGGDEAARNAPARSGHALGTRKAAARRALSTSTPPPLPDPVTITSTRSSEKGPDEEGGPLDPKEVAALRSQWEEKGDWRAAKELGLRLLNYGRGEADWEGAVTWLQHATQSNDSHDSSHEKAGEGGSGDAEALYGLALAYEKVDREHRSEVLPDEEEEEAGLGVQRGESYGAKSGIELVRIVRTKANTRRKMRLAPPSAASGEVGVPVWLLPVAYRRSLPAFEAAARLGHKDAMVHAGNIYFHLSHNPPSPPTLPSPRPPRSRRGQTPPTQQEVKEAGGERKKEEEKLCPQMLLRRAVGWWEEGEKGGHGDAAFNLGQLYYEGGPGVDPNPSRAVEYFQTAAKLGDASAAFWLGHAYRTGDAGVSVDGGRSLSYLTRACEQDHPAACYYLAMLYREGDPEVGVMADIDKFRGYLDKAVRLGDGEALFCLADMHLHGTDGAARDMSKAMALYEAAGRAGHDQALVCLGALQHQQGLYHKAFLTYQRAAEGGSEQAWRNLAAMYALGQGTEKNETIAAHILKTIKGQGEGK